MKKSMIALAVLALAGAIAPVRARTHDVAFTYRMGAGFPGDVNRTHPASIMPGLMDGTDPVRLYGDPVLLNAGSTAYRGFKVGDAATKIAGLLVRPYPTQQSTNGMSASLGAAVPPQTAGSVIDLLEDGYAMAKCNNFAVNAPLRGGAVYVRIAATAGALIQGGFHAAADGVNTVAITNARWAGPADADGVAEIQVWVA